MGRDFQMTSLENSLLTAEGLKVSPVQAGVALRLASVATFVEKKVGLSPGKETEEEKALNS